MKVTKMWFLWLCAGYSISCTTMYAYLLVVHFYIMMQKHQSNCTQTFFAGLQKYVFKQPQSH